MKKIIALSLVLFASVSIFAQQQLATLNHNDTITAFYGVTALQQAHAAAVNGDIILLSSGSFNGVNITKAITIRGVGMVYDTVADTDPTIITGILSMDVPNNTSYHLTLEGLSFTGLFVTYLSLSSPQFIKCMFKELQNNINYDGQHIVENATFVSCIIKKLANYYSGYYASRFLNATFTNCAILTIEPYGDPNEINSCNFYNCIAKISNTAVSRVNSDTQSNAFTFSNCILYANITSNYNNASASCNNCIGISCNSDSTINYFSNNGNNRHNHSDMFSVFKYFNGTYYDGISFELRDNIATTILGNDGTEVGVYGGMYPFNPRVNSPRFVRCNVAPHSTADGKLSVDIEVVSE